jgi:hypothetical protein
MFKNVLLISFLIVIAFIGIILVTSHPSDAKYYITDIKYNDYYVDSYDVIDDGIRITSQYYFNWFKWIVKDCDITLSGYIIKELD